ncbi:hypothetical protein Hanom_Chr07g00649161 [Helianthus anomalus]
MVQIVGLEAFILSPFSLFVSTLAFFKPRPLSYQSKRFFGCGSITTFNKAQKSLSSTRFFDRPYQKLVIYRVNEYF